jgi:hypothetical protein
LTVVESSYTTFAGGHKKYEKSQALSQANTCGNGKLPLNAFCQNIDSQVQGDENEVALAGTQQAQDNGFDGGDYHGGHNGDNGGEAKNDASTKQPPQ